MLASSQGLLAPSVTANGCEASESLELWVYTVVSLLSAVTLCLLIAQSMRHAPVQGQPHHGSIDDTFRHNDSSESVFSSDLGDSTGHFRRSSETPDDHVIWIKWDLATDAIATYNQGPGYSSSD